jgi:hypothetical protein
MSKPKPWYKVVTPREDLREGRPLDASEFAVHLDHIREGHAHVDYQDPVRFFQRTFLTKNLLAVASEVQRRLSGVNTEASAVFNMTTQFGGGKTHALALLYHLAKAGAAAKDFAGVSSILQKAGVSGIPNAHVGIFVGTRFSLLKGAGGEDGTPHRKTPWGELAWQLGGETSYAAIKEYDEQGIAPSGTDIRAMMPKDGPSLLLIDEVMNYICGERKTTRAGELYRFLMNLSEEITGMNGVVAVVSIPASELEMTAEDEADYARLKKMLDRKGKPVIMSSENEMSEIIRRRLFEWDMRAISADGRVLLSQEAVEACKEYADWVQDHRNQVPNWFTDHAVDAFQATYPFHPMVISVFERKWRELPRFQQTRGVLRLLALWVSHVYQTGFKGAQNDLLITLGSAPLEDSQFRTAVFEQLGQDRLEGAVTTDIAGKKESHSLLLDGEAEETLRKAQVHRRTATAVFFESNGGQGEKRQCATVPELRMAVGGPGVDVGNVETALEGLVDRCYYLTLDRNSYYFSLKENLNKRYADRRASVKDEDVEQLVREETEGIFGAVEGVERVFFAEVSGQIPNRAVVTMVVVAPNHCLHDDPGFGASMLAMTKEYGTTMRAFKSALIWIVPDSADVMREEARKLLAWEAIDAEIKPGQLDDNQQRLLADNIKRSRRDLKESVWRSYNKVMLLAKDNTLKTVDLGLVTSSAAESLTKLVISVLRQNDEIVKAVSPRFLVTNWPPAKPEWSIKDVRDAFFSSPQFPRLLGSDVIKGAIVRGVAEGQMAYVAKGPGGGYEPFVYKRSLSEGDIEMSDDFYVIKGEDAERHIKPPVLAKVVVVPESVFLKPGQKQTFIVKGFDQFGKDIACGAVAWSATGGSVGGDGVYQCADDEGNFLVHASVGGFTGSAGVSVVKKAAVAVPVVAGGAPGEKALRWSGEIPPQKWMNFYTKVLSKLLTIGGLKVVVSIQSAPAGGATPRQAEEVKTALRGLGLNDSADVS